MFNWRSSIVPEYRHVKADSAFAIALIGDTAHAAAPHRRRGSRRARLYEARADAAGEPSKEAYRKESAARAAAR